MSSTLNTLIEGVSAIQRGNFSVAIEFLEKYCQNFENNSEGKFSDYIYAQQNIVKAYSYLGEKDKAIQRTKELAINTHPQVRKWAKCVLASLSPEDFKSLPEEIIQDENLALWDNESAAMVLHSVNQYLEFGSDSSIVEALETACESIQANTKEYLYAQVLLIEAYHCNGEFKNAVALSKQLIHSKHYLTRLLANQYLSSLSANHNLVENIEEDKTKLFTHTQASAIYQQGYDALTGNNKDEAIEIFEKYCESTLPGSREYLQARLIMVQGYQNRGKSEKAILLCTKLIKCKHKPSVRWARELLFTSLFHDNLPENAVENLKDIQSEVDLVKSKNPLLKAEKSHQSFVVKENQSQKNSTKTVSQPFRLRTLDEFKQFCQQNLLDDLKVFETRRKQALATIIIWSIMVFSILLVLFRFSPSYFFQPIWNNDDILFISFIGISAYFSTSWFTNMVCFLIFSVIYLVLILILFIIYSLFYNSTFDNFIYKFDDKIIHKIYKFINTNQNLTISNISSEIERNQTLTDIQNSQLFNSLLKPNYIEQNHLIYGNIKNTNIRFANLKINSGINHDWTKIFDINMGYFISKTENIIDINLAPLRILILLISIPSLIILLTLRLFKGIPYVLNRIVQGKNLDFQRFQTEILKNQSYNNQVFQGLFFTAKFNKLSPAVTIIRPKLLKTNLNSLYYGKKQLVKLEDPEFNSLFTVYSEDQVQARYILSTSLMEKLVKFRQKANKNIYVSFIHDTIYIAVEYPDGIFEPNLFQNMVRFAPLRKYFQAIHLMLGIVEDLQLDRQIWQSN